MCKKYLLEEPPAGYVEKISKIPEQRMLKVNDLKEVTKPFFEEKKTLNKRLSFRIFIRIFHLSAPKGSSLCAPGGR